MAMENFLHELKRELTILQSDFDREFHEIDRQQQVFQRRCQGLRQLLPHSESATYVGDGIIQMSNGDFDWMQEIPSRQEITEQIEGVLDRVAVLTTKMEMLADRQTVLASRLNTIDVCLNEESSKCQLS